MFPCSMMMTSNVEALMGEWFDVFETSLANKAADNNDITLREDFLLTGDRLAVSMFLEYYVYSVSIFLEYHIMNLAHFMNI